MFTRTVGVATLLLLAFSSSAAMAASGPRSSHARRASRARALVRHIPRSRYAHAQRAPLLRSFDVAVRRASGKDSCAALRAMETVVNRLNAPSTWRRATPPRAALRKPSKLLARVVRNLLRRAGRRCAAASRIVSVVPRHGGDVTSPHVPPPTDVNEQGEELVEEVRPGAFRPSKQIGAPTSVGLDPHGAATGVAARGAMGAAGAFAASAPDPLQVFRSSDVGVPPRTGNPMEPTAAIAGRVVWFTGNRSVALSTDAGRTFTTFDPSNVLPDNGMAFCCDQLVTYSSASDIFVWVTQYWCRTIPSCFVSDSAGNARCASPTQSTGSNRVRISVASPRDLVQFAANPARAWTSWDITAQALGQPAAAWFDRSSLSVSRFNVNWSVDNVCGNAGSVLGRLPLSRLAARGPVPLSFLMDAPAVMTAAQGELASTSYYTGNNEANRARIWSWDAFSPVMFRHDIDHASVPNLNSATPGTDGADWFARFGGFPTAVESSTVSGRTLYLAQGSGRDICSADCAPGGKPTIKHVFDRPAVLITRYDVDTWRLLGERWLWHPTLTLGWPALQTDAAGDVGIALRAGDVNHNPRPIVGFLTPEEQFNFVLPEGLPHLTGDYYSLRPGRTGHSFVTTAQTVQNDPAGPTMHWNFIEYGHGPSPFVAAPNVRIAAPADLTAFTQGETVQYRADVSDAIDGTLPAAAIVWREDGTVFGSGATPSHVEAAVGTHVISVTATNGDGRSASAQISIRVQPPQPPQAPVVKIVQPRDGDFACADASDGNGSFHDTPFSATATDPAGLPLRFRWTDSVNGGGALQLSTQLSPTLRLFLIGNTVTTHDLTLFASNGTTTGSAQVRFFVKPIGACIP